MPAHSSKALTANTQDVVRLRAFNPTAPKVPSRPGGFFCALVLDQGGADRRHWGIAFNPPDG
jgi:hypothetical protein